MESLTGDASHPTEKLKRSRTEQLFDVLECIADGTDKPTSLMYRSQLNWKSLTHSLEILESQGLIHTTWKNGYATLQRVGIMPTERGRVLLRQYREIMKQVAPDEVIYVGDVK